MGGIETRDYLPCYKSSWWSGRELDPGLPTVLQIQLVVRAGIETRGLPTVLQIQLVVRAGIEPGITYRVTNPAGGQGGN